MYGIIGGLALALALGTGGGSATNQQGALTVLARAPLGKLALTVLAVALLAYALWKIGVGLAGQGPEGGSSGRWTDRVANLGGGAVYLVFFVIALRVLAGAGQNSSAQQRQAAAGVLGWPGGPVLVAAAGLAFIVICAVQGREGVTGAFMKEIKTDRLAAASRPIVDALGRVGLVARALVFALVGWFLVRTAIDYDPNQAVGIDGALHNLAQQSHGALLLGIVAAGLIVFALFSLLEGVYRRL